MPPRKPRKQPDFSVLKKTLAQSKNELDNATYQTIQGIIEKLIQQQSINTEEKTEIVNIIKKSTSSGSGGAGGGGSAGSSYLTISDETADLPNSVRLAAGTNITFDDSVPGIRTISSVGGNSGYWAPLTDGDLVETELIFADGECIMVHVP